MFFVSIFAPRDHVNRIIPQSGLFTQNILANCVRAEPKESIIAHRTFSSRERSSKTKQWYLVASQSRYSHLDSFGRRPSSKTLNADCRKGRLWNPLASRVVGEWAEPMMGLLMGELIGYLLVRCTPLSRRISPLVLSRFLSFSLALPLFCVSPISFLSSSTFYVALTPTVSAVGFCRLFSEKLLLIFWHSAVKCFYGQQNIIAVLFFY